MQGVRSRLSYSARKQIGQSPAPYPPDLLDAYDTPLLVLIDHVYFLPISWRKYILNFCRMQQSPISNDHLKMEWQTLRPSILVVCDEVYRGYTYNITDINNFLDAICYSPIACSLLSYFVRAEGTYHKEDFLAEKTKSFDKEFLAATDATVRGQQLNYGILTGMDIRVNPEFSGPESPMLIQYYQRGLYTIRSKYSRELSKLILPAYNGAKNVGYQTQAAYCGFLNIENPHKSITSLDLLRLYAETGFKTPGPLEMRQAWFYNDLKPRTYYCLGGDAYWAGLYIQPIANEIAKILPSTNPFSRFNVSRLPAISTDHFLITYDYTSFTSTLSELKYYLHWLGMALHGVPVTLFDPSRGVIENDMGDMIHDYNNLVNHYQAFSTERFFDLVPADAVYHLGQNGGLGTKGNIVFSTCVHGLNLGSLSGTPDCDCCVGDDALARILRLLIEVFIRGVNYLGIINREKFSVVESRSVDPLGTTSFKFLKRPLFLDERGSACLGILDFFPDLASSLNPSGDGIHSVRPGGSRAHVAASFFKQVGRYYRLCRSHLSELDVTYEEDLTVVLGALQAVYKVLGVPFEGAVEGECRVEDVPGIWVPIHCAIPPCDTVDVFRIHWADILLLRKFGTKVIVPVTVGGTIPPPIDPLLGQSFDATSELPALALFEALGYVERELYFQEEEWDYRYVEEFKSKEGTPRSELEPMLCKYTYVRQCPFWYDVMRCYTPDPEGEDILEALTVVASLTADSAE